MPDSLTSAQRQEIIHATHERISQASEGLGGELPLIEVTFDVTGHTWGYYRRQGKKRSIRYNPQIFSQHFEEGINTTIPHEVAHYVVDTLYTGKRKPHGAEWKNTMAFFGIPNARATHTSDMSNIPSRRQPRHLYRCGCQSHELSTTRHNKIQYRGMAYFCCLCGEKLIYGTSGNTE